MPALPRSCLVLLGACCAAVAAAGAAGPACQAQSGATLTPVLELYTSEGCSSCPPADRWLSSLKEPARGGRVVAQAFHVGYWDSLGWVDRFASSTHTQRQREIAARQGASSIYTPQLVRNGRDLRDYASALDAGKEAAGAVIRLARRLPDTVEAEVTPVAAGRPWAAYWTVTEHAHASKVSAGENAGEQLRHDFVVRQYVPVARQDGPKTLKLTPVPAQPGHPQQVNLVVFDPATGTPLQALSLQCGG
jgi:hypothetical protein